MTGHESLLKRKFWIFDLDGTITVAAHDFSAIRNELGIPTGMPIVETIKSLPEKESKHLKKKLNEMEEKLARNATPAPGVKSLFESLYRFNYKLGILTLNSRENAFFTLKSIGLSKYFKKESVIGRWCAEPKPSPDGIFKILKNWGVKSNEALMVGDYLYDLQVGRAAKVGTVHVDISGGFPWPELSDIKVKSLDDLTKLLKKQK